MKKVADFPPLGRRFFARPAEVVARELLGHALVRILDDGTVLAGRIVETEAYPGPHDPASHSSRGMTEVLRHLWGPPNFSYVYLSMGTSYCLNIVVEPAGRAGCVLLRALEPLVGIERMRCRRPKAKKDTDLCSGPGRLCQALDIDMRLNKADMTGGHLFVARARKKAFTLGVSPRIGISKATNLPLRFYIMGNSNVSRAKPTTSGQKERRM